MRLEPFLISVVIWLCIAVVVMFVFTGCAVPLR